MGKIKVYGELPIAKTDDKLFSSFLEHLGRAIYGGIYDPEHELADESGFRLDVIELIKELNVDYIRYPGGNFVSGYRWKDGVGDYRPTRIDYAWRTLDLNKIGINEFSEYTQKTNTKLMGAVNLGTGSPMDAADLVEYCNFPGGTELSDMRISHGYDAHDIKIWCLGNEMDGDWQTCALSADDYGKKAKEAAKMMKWVDPSIELVGVGSSSCRMDTYPEWDRKVLEYLYDYVDYLSLHIYFENEGNEQDFLKNAYRLNNFIDAVGNTVQYVKTLKRSSKKVYLSLDEWNIWNYTRWNEAGYGEKPMNELEHAPKLLEDNYTYIDAIAFASLTISILNNSDKVKIACLAQLVNVIAPILTETNGRVIRQSIYYPFQLFSKYGRGIVLTTVNKFDDIEVDGKRESSVISCCVLSEDESNLTIFAVNIDMVKDHELEIDLIDLKDYKFVEEIKLESDDLYATNTFDDPEKINLQHSNKVNFTINPCSYKVYRYELED